MEVFPEQAMALVKNVVKDHLQSANCNEMISCLDKDTRLIALGKGEIAQSYQDIAKMLVNRKTRHYDIVDEWYDVQKLTPEICIVYGCVQLKETGADKNAEGREIRFSAVCKQENEEIKICHVHHSEITHEKEHAGKSSENMVELSNEIFKKTLLEKVAELDRLNEEFLEREARYKFAMEATNDIVFEADYATQEITIDRKKLMELYEISQDMLEREGIYGSILQVVHPDDYEKCSDWFQIRKENKLAVAQISSVEYRVKNSASGYIWIESTVVPIADTCGRIIKYIGHIKNIDVQKRKEIQMASLCKEDSLTQFLNRKSTEDAINTYLQIPGNTGTLMMIDIDDFKGVNDRFGHLFGDKVLTTLTKQIKSLFRVEDILGRTGGDEFVIFLKNINIREVVEKKADQAIQMFTKVLESEQEPCRISASIGISIAPEDGDNFTALWKKADKALYHAKGQGKGTYSFFKNDSGC